MRILQICYAYPPSFSGYGKQLDTINKELVANNNETHISVLTAFDGNYHKENIQKNISVFSFFNKERTFYKSTTLVAYLFSILVIFRFFKEFYSADVVHVVKAGAEAAVAVLLCKIFNKPVIVKVVQNDIVSKDEDVYIGVITTFKNKIITQWADRIIAISHQIEKNIKTHGVQKIRISNIPNSINTNRFTPSTKQKKDFGEEIKFLYIGSITKRKGVYDLLQAIKELNIDTNATFIFVGPNYNEIKDFESHIETIDQSNSMISAKYIPYTSTPEKILQEVDFLILPSYSEGMPNVVLESFSSAVPTILSDIPVHCELANDNYTRLYELGNVLSLRKVLEVIIDNPDELSARKQFARDYVIINHDVSLIASLYNDLYKEL